MQEGSYARRIHGLGVLLALVGLLAIGRLFWLQVVRHDYYGVLASEEQLRKFEVLPGRGAIYANDRGQKHPVAINRDRKRLYVDPRFVQDPTETAAALAAITEADPDHYLEALRTDSFYVVLAHGLDAEKAKTITKLDMPGVGLQDEPERIYPEGNLAAHVLGFVNNDGMGQYGVEEAYNQQLSGQRGLLKATTDTRGIPIATSENFQISPRQGSDIVLTIDRNIQAKVEQVLGEGMKKYRAKQAAAVIMDPSSGAILAMAGYPSFDPTHFDQVENYQVFANPAVNQIYEPGSVIKIFTMAAGLEQKAVAPTTSYHDSGSVTIDDRTIQNARGIPTGNHTMNEVIANSINTGVVFVLQQLGGGSINSQAKGQLHDFFAGRFQLGQPTGVDLPGETAGLIKEPDAPNVDYANMAFGQGMSTNMLQVVTGFAAVANGGTLFQPYVVDRIETPGGEITKTEPKVRAKDLLSDTTIDQLKSMMEAVINNPSGPEAKAAGYRIGGKSGTAQIPNPDGGYFEDRDIGSFVGIAPLSQPRFVMMVRIDEPQIGTFASAAARPLWGEIMRWLLNYSGVPPQG